MSDMSNPAETGWTYNLSNLYSSACRQGRSVALDAHPFPAALPATLPSALNAAQCSAALSWPA
jgi:hypothetical protein